MTPQDEILRDLLSSEMMDLMNVYKGLPIVNRATIQGSSHDTLTFKIHKQQAACLKIDKHPLILSGNLRDVASGEVVALDLTQLTASLTHFEYAGHRIRGRMVVRVEPKDPIQVRLVAGAQTFTVLLADIGMEGIGVRAPQTNGLPKRHVTVEMDFQLPNARIKCNGSVRHITQESGAGFIGIDFAHGTSVRALVNHYVMHRREEILQELE